jgi:hypothetical protein
MEKNEEEVRKVIFKYYLLWLDNLEEPKNINDLRIASGLSRQTLYSILSKEKFKMPKQKTIIALANVWGDEFYTALGMNKPEVNGKSIEKNWDKLPDEVRKQIIGIVKPYLAN